MSRVPYTKADISPDKLWRFTGRVPDPTNYHLFRAEVRDGGTLYISGYSDSSFFPYRFDSLSENFRLHKTESEVINLKTLLVAKSFVDAGEVMALKELLIELEI